MAREITVTIEGQITDYNKRLYNERLAIALLNQYGADSCRELLRLIEARGDLRNDSRKIEA